MELVHRSKCRGRRVGKAKRAHHVYLKFHYRRKTWWARFALPTLHHLRYGVRVW